MLTQYKNIDEIKNAVRSLSGERIANRKLQFASYDINETVRLNTDITTQTDMANYFLIGQQHAQRKKYDN